MNYQWTDTDHKINAILEKNPEAWCANCAYSRKGRTFNGWHSSILLQERQRTDSTMAMC